MMKANNSMSIPTTIISRYPEGICAITGKTGEVFELRIGEGEIQTVSSTRLLEVLRLATSIRISPTTTTSEE
jgi:hypothetical protein